jgi:two-component system sensor histidine kinase UhpB
MSLRLQVNLIITTLLALFASVLIGLQIDNTRRSVHEEVLGANVVATQLLSRAQWIYGNSGLLGMTEFLHQVGRIRANDVQLQDDEGTVVYQSPESSYKAGRAAPAWYSALVSPPLQPQVIRLPIGRILLQADASRAVLDGWDDLHPMLWTVLAGFVLGNALVYALIGHALRPLHQLVLGLRQVADGQYDTRLSNMVGREGRQIGQAFNHMAQSVQESIEAKRQSREAAQALAENRALTQMIQARIELERAAISRELHDEMGQQVTAIKSVGLAIARRAADTDPSIAQSARLVMQCADQIYDGMHHLIAKLRPLALDQFGLYDALRDLLSDYQMQHPELEITATLPDVLEAPNDALATAVYRIVQEALTNVLRHAQASQVEVCVLVQADQLLLSVCDNGCGRVSQFPSRGHFGLSGMRERVQALGGSYHLLQREPAGIEIQVRLPFSKQQHDA